MILKTRACGCGKCPLRVSTHGGRTYHEACPHRDDRIHAARSLAGRARKRTPYHRSGR